MADARPTVPSRRSLLGRRTMVLCLTALALVVPGATSSLAAGNTVTFTSVPASPGKTTSPTWTFSVPGNGALTCQLTPPGGPADAAVDCTSGRYTASLGGRPQGTYALRVAETSGGPVSTSTYVLDTIAPPQPTITGPTGPSRQTTATFTLASSEAGVAFLCIVSGPNGTAPIDCSAGTWATSFLTDGTYVGDISVYDAAGNRSTSAFHSYTLDRVAPAAPTITRIAGPHPPRTPSYQLAGEPGGTWSCSVTAPDSTVSPVACAAGPLTLSLNGADGPWSLAARQTDGAGNIGALATVNYLLDTVAPSAPGVTGPSGPSQDASPTFTLSGEAGATYVCEVGDPAGGTTAVACAAGSLTLSLTSGNGTYELRVRQRDASGNTSVTTTVRYDFDASSDAPGVEGPAGPSTDRRPDFLLSAEPLATLTCRVTAPGGAVTTPACAAGTFELDLTAGVDGLWRLAVTQQDVAGNVSDATVVTYTLDTTPPAAPGVAGPLGPHLAHRPGYALSGESGATYACTLTGTGVSETPACAEGILVLELGGYADGTFTLSVTQTDRAGLPSPATVRTYVLDTTAPAMPGITGPTGPSPDRSPVFTLDGEPGGSWACTVTDPAGGYTSVPCAEGELTLSLPATDGDYLLSVTQSDGAGNVSPTAGATYVLRQPAASPSPSPTDTSPSPSPIDTSPSPSPSAPPVIGPTAPPFIGPVAPTPPPFIGPVAPAPTTEPTTAPTTVPSTAPSPAVVPSPAAPAARAPAATAPPGPIVAAPPASEPTTEPTIDTVAETPAEAPGEPVAEPPAEGSAAQEPDSAAAPAEVAAIGKPLPLPTASPRLPLTRITTASRATERLSLRGAEGSGAGGISRWRETLRLAAVVGENGGPPLLLLLIAFAFLAAQDRIDRNDPKLALAPVQAHQELMFKPMERGAL